MDVVSQLIFLVAHWKHEQLGQWLKLEAKSNVSITKTLRKELMKKMANPRTVGSQKRFFKI